MKKITFLLIAVLCLYAVAASEAACKHEWGSYKSVSAGSHSTVCRLCGEERNEAHSLETVREAATCISPAKVTYRCIRCGYETESYSEGSVGTEHSWGKAVTIKEPTCTNEGSQQRTCALCGTVETIVLDMADHTYGAWKSSDDYSHTRRCVNCGAEQTDKHDSAIARTVTYAQDTRLGKKSYTCTLCGFMYTRYYAATNSKLYKAEDDYIAVETIDVKRGESAVIRMYPDAVYELYAETDSAITVYANAQSLEYRGLKLENGTASLKYISGTAVLEFLQTDECAVLCVDASEGAVIAGNTSVNSQPGNTCSITEIAGGSAVFRLYTADKAEVTEDEIGIAGDAQPEAEIRYDSAAQRLTITIDDNGYGVNVFADGKNLYEGKNSRKYECGLARELMSDGWYVVFTGSNNCTTPVFSADGSFMAAAADSNAAVITEENEIEEAPIEEEAPNILGFASVMETIIHMSPDIRVAMENGVYSVTVNEMPTGWKVNYITIVQQYGESGYKLTNTYAPQAEFEIVGGAGFIRAEVYLTDSAGDPIHYSAGNYELIGY